MSKIFNKKVLIFNLIENFGVNVIILCVSQTLHTCIHIFFYLRDGFKNEWVNLPKKCFIALSQSHKRFGVLTYFFFAVNILLCSAVCHINIICLYKIKYMGLCYKTFYSCNLLIQYCNVLACLSLAVSSTLVKYLKGSGSNLLLELSSVRGSTRVSFNLACNDQTRVEETDSEKHSSLLQYGINYSLKKVHSTGPTSCGPIFVQFYPSWGENPGSFVYLYLTLPLSYNGFLCVESL